MKAGSDEQEKRSSCVCNVWEGLELEKHKKEQQENNVLDKTCGTCEKHFTDVVSKDSKHIENCSLWCKFLIFPSWCFSFFKDTFNFFSGCAPCAGDVMAAQSVGRSHFHIFSTTDAWHVVFQMCSSGLRSGKRNASKQQHTSPPGSLTTASTHGRLPS